MAGWPKLMVRAGRQSGGAGGLALRERRRAGRGIVSRQWRRAPRGVGREAVDPRAGRNRSGMIRTPRVRAPDPHRDQGRRADQRLGRRSSARPTQYFRRWHLRQGRLHAARLVATPMLPARRTAGHRAVDR